MGEVAPAGAAGMAAELRRRLGPAAAPAGAPLVSVVVVNRDGVEHLDRLLAGLAGATDYPRLELIVVDNGSSDGSLELLRSAQAPFPILILANPHNESFSDASNRGAEVADGELLLFLNNDVEPFERGWLRELVGCLRERDAGAVGATLLLAHEDGERFPHGLAVQCRGLRFRDEGGEIWAALEDWEADPLDRRAGEDLEAPAVVGACVLISRTDFRRIGGFPRGYLYGGEDIDICLTLRAAGRPVLCSGRSVLIHRPGSTRRRIGFEEGRERKLGNYRLLMERWGARLRREHDLDALAGGGMWVQPGREGGTAARSRDAAEALAVCVRAGERTEAEEGALGELWAVAQAATGRSLLLRDGEVGARRGLEYDVAIHLRGEQRYILAPGQFNVLWAPRPRPGLSGAECGLYDLVLCGEGAEAIRLQAESSAAVAVAPPGGVLGAALAAAQAAGRPRRIG